MTRPSGRGARRSGSIGIPGAVGHLEHGAEAVRGRLVGPHHPELPVRVALHHVAQERAEDARRLARGAARLAGRRPRSRGSRAGRGRAAGGRRWRAGWRPCAARPGAPAPRARGAARPARRRAPRAGSSAASPRAARGARGWSSGRRAAPGGSGRSPRPACRRPPWARSSPSGSQHDHRPARPRPSPPFAGGGLDRVDLLDHLVEGRGHRRCTSRARRPRRSAARSRSPRAASAARRADPGQHRRVGDLVAVQVEDRQHRAVPRGVEELVRVPARGQRARLGLAVADHAADQQVRVVERGAVGVQQRVAELAALVDRARRLGATWLGIPPGNENWRNRRPSPPRLRPMCG